LEVGQDVGHGVAEQKTQKRGNPGNAKGISQHFHILRVGKVKKTGKILKSKGHASVPARRREAVEQNQQQGSEEKGEGIDGIGIGKAFVFHASSSSSGGRSSSSGSSG